MRETIKSIQFLRFVAATLVVLVHSTEAILPVVPEGPGATVLHIAGIGGSGVHIFFVISGFIMIYTSFAGDAKFFSPSNFLLRRFIRIYPIYWVYAALYILFPIVSQGYHLPASDLLGSLLLLPGNSSDIIGQGWTLSYEVYFYICFAVFMSLRPLKGLIAMTVFFAASIALGGIFHFNSEALHVFTNPLLTEFLGGAWIAYFFLSRTRLAPTASNALVILGIGLFIAGIVFGYHVVPSTLLWGLPSAFVITGLIFKERAKTLPSFVLKYSFLGDSSYSLYLLHLLVIGAFFKLFPGLAGDQPTYIYVLIPLLLTGLCVLICVASYELVERRLVSTLQTAVKSLQRRRVSKPAN